MNLERRNRGARLRARKLGVGVAAVAAIAAGLIAGCGGGGDPGGTQRSGALRGGSQAATITVSDRVVGRRIPQGFLGLSFEYPAVTFYTGSRTLNRVFVRLIQNLTPGQAPVLRIGGDSTDTSWWPVPGLARPPWLKYTLTPGWLAATRSLAIALGARLILGINLEADSPAIAATEAHELVNGIGRQYIEALELGNEPEAYGSLPWYDTAAGTPVYARPSWYSSAGLASYTADFSAIRKVLPNVPLAGPATGGLRQLAHLGQFLRAEPGLGVVTFHRYPLNRCFVTSDSPQVATLANLLSRRSSRGLVRGIAPYVALAHSEGLPFRIDETNSVACGGKLGLSDTFASALWAIDALFSMARIGVDGVNIHTFPGARYSLFAFDHGGGPRRALVHPEYYGLLMFARAAPAGSALLALSSTAPASVRAWATLAADGTRRVLLINDSLKRSRSVLIRLPSPPPGATLERLQAPSVRSSVGVTLAGQGFGLATGTGALAGGPQPIAVRRTAGGYQLTLPAAGAALLTIAPR